ncbi:MAG: RNA polymerase sigma factor [Actinobacteria bacterium]|nr:RNA polymerase sigma factor [Actinomycetota bacterium]
MDAPPLDTLTAALAADLDGAFPDLVRLLQDDLFSGALRLTGGWADAEDVAQEAFVRAYRALQGYPPERIRALRLRGWMWTIALNLCRNRARSRARRPETALGEGVEPPDTGVGPEQAALDADGSGRLGALVAGLPWAQRRGVVLRHVVGLSYEEIAAAVERPVGTVKADVHRGLARLRAAVGTEEAP